MTFFKEEMNITDKLGGMLLKYDPKIGLVIMEGRISFHSGAQNTTVSLPRTIAPEPLSVGHKEQSGLLVLFQYYLVVEVVLDGSDQCG